VFVPQASLAGKRKGRTFQYYSLCDKGAFIGGRCVRSERSDISRRRAQPRARSSLTPWSRKLLRAPRRSPRPPLSQRPRVRREEQPTRLNAYARSHSRVADAASGAAPAASSSDESKGAAPQIRVVAGKYGGRQGLRFFSDGPNTHMLEVGKERPQPEPAAPTAAATSAAPASAPSPAAPRATE
jgi:hypothetical protein